MWLKMDSATKRKVKTSKKMQFKEIGNKAIDNEDRKKSIPLKDNWYFQAP